MSIQILILGFKGLTHIRFLFFSFFLARHREEFVDSDIELIFNLSIFLQLLDFYRKVASLNPQDPLSLKVRN